MVHRTAFLFALAPLCALATACGDAAATDGDPAASSGEGGEDGSGDADAGPVIGSCTYVNTFADAPECRQYRGPGWTAESAAADCESVFLGSAGTFTADIPCTLDDVIGTCVVGDLGGTGYETLSTGTADGCGTAQAACEGFAGGTFEPAAVCGSCAASEEDTAVPFTPPYEDCRDPMPGEPAGASDGQVCTPTIISGATEPGRYFPDYADCDVIRTQRPYYPAPPADATDPDPNDPRLDDGDYMTELAWVREQAAASACTCCHTASDTPGGAALWDIDAGPLWIDTVSDRALSMLAGFTDSAAFGFLPPEQSNGFDRSQSGLPTTDLPRLQAFAERELTRRGVTMEEAAQLPPFAPQFQDLIDYRPEPCDEGLGMDEGGRLLWTGGPARYVSVLRADATSPGLPPNWDLPAGTLWAISVPPQEAAMGCGMGYGELSDQTVQRFPESGAPEPLVSGETYYLHVQRDVALPITRCLFVAP